MAVDFANETTKRLGGLYSDYPENILVSPELNGRHTHTEIESLAADIEKDGQIEAVGARKNDDGQPVLIFGHRRYRAISLLNQKNPDKKRKVFFHYFNVNETEAFELTIRENRNRQEVSPIDDAYNIRILEKKFGYTHEDIATIYFPEARSKEKKAEALRFVAQRAALQELAPEAAQAVRDGRVKVTAAVALAKLTKAQQREKVAGNGKIKGSDIVAPKQVPGKSLLREVRALLAECDKQPDVMVYEIPKELVMAIREAIK